MVPTSQDDVSYFTTPEKQTTVVATTMPSLESPAECLTPGKSILTSSLTSQLPLRFKRGITHCFPCRPGQYLKTTASAWKTKKLNKGVKLGHLAHCPQLNCQSRWFYAHSQGDEAKSGIDGVWEEAEQPA